MSTLFKSLATHVESIVESYRHSPENIIIGESIGEFISKTEPIRKIKSYMRQIQGICCDEEWLFAVMLVDKMMRKLKKHITPLSIHRLVITAVMVSIKMMRDCVCRVPNFMSQYTRISVAELCLMERTFLELIDWNVHVSCKDYEAFVKFLTNKKGDNTPILLVPAKMKGSPGRILSSVQFSRSPSALTAFSAMICPP